mmetsp:Transcript_24602/g.76552  ORF Transcript_24602/g.76552 Transcript_24602/m.76552 type:complete len:301 (-) Transcript_24602:265-1167(-)
MSLRVTTPFMAPSPSTIRVAQQLRDARRSPTLPSVQSMLQAGVSSFLTNSATGECNVRLAANSGCCTGVAGRPDSTMSSADSMPTMALLSGCTTTRWCSRRSVIMEAASTSRASPATSRASASPGAARARNSATPEARGRPPPKARKTSRGVTMPRTPSSPATSKLFCLVANITFSTCRMVYFKGHVKTSSQVFMASCTVLSAMSPMPTPGKSGQDIAWASSSEERTPRKGRPPAKDSSWTITWWQARLPEAMFSTMRSATCSNGRSDRTVSRGSKWPGVRALPLASQSPTVCSSGVPSK